MAGTLLLGCQQHELPPGLFIGLGAVRGWHLQKTSPERKGFRVHNEVRGVNASVLYFIRPPLVAGQTQRKRQTTRR